VFAFAVRSLVRQPARAGLGVLGVATVGALLFDMLLLSRGLVVSLRGLLDSTGFDVRVSATDATFAVGPRIKDAAATAAALAGLADVEQVVPLRLGEVEVMGGGGKPLPAVFLGIDPGPRAPWTVLSGNDLAEGAHPAVLVNRNMASTLRLTPGGEVMLRGPCAREPGALPPQRFRVAGIVEFKLEDAAQMTAASTLPDFARACGEPLDEADLLLVAARAERGPAEAVAAIRRARPDLHPFSNEELVAWFQRTGFSYFRQISTVLATVTLFFGFLLVTVLLTVSVNQRLAEIAALRALGFSRRRVVFDVLCQSALLVGAGGLMALPLGAALAAWLDAILRALPGIPADLHFFVFHGRALALHTGLLAATALLAALYPMRLVARLPIAATLRSEVVD
jgi:putative ABC transport system permease protein